MLATTHFKGGQKGQALAASPGIANGLASSVASKRKEQPADRFWQTLGVGAISVLSD